MKTLKEIKLNLPANIRNQHDNDWFVAYYSMDTLQKELAQLINIEELCKRAFDLKVVNFSSSGVIWLMLILPQNSENLKIVDESIKFLDENSCLNVDKYLETLNQINS